MPGENRGEGGRFVPKGDSNRKVRSVRLTDHAWDRFGEIAESQGMTRGDYLECLLNLPQVTSASSNDKCTQQSNHIQEIIDILNYSLTLRSNAGGAIKKEIKKVLELLTDSN